MVPQEPVRIAHSSICGTGEHSESVHAGQPNFTLFPPFKNRDAPGEQFFPKTPCIFPNGDYDAVGNRSEVDLPNGVVTTYLYDSLNRLTNLVHQSGMTNLASYSYKLDATGRRTNAVEVLWQESGSYLTNTFSWQFDGLYRLTNEVSQCSATGFSYTNGFVYDLNGNRLKQVRTGNSVTTITNLYDANDQLLLEVTRNGGSLVDSNSYAYDANGSVTGKTNSTGTLNYTYNVANKLSSVLSGGVPQASYLYNDQGIRVQSVSGTTNHFLIDANNHTGYAQVLEELPTIGATPSTSYVIGDEVLAQCGTTYTAPSYFLPDGHGNNRQLTHPDGTISSHFSYEAYGAVLGTSTSCSADAAVASGITTKLYCGEQYDAKLHMYNLRARYYDAGNGRFNQRDTFTGNNEDPQTMHKYLYTSGNPIEEIDPTGNFWEWVFGFALLALAILAIALLIQYINTTRITGKALYLDMSNFNLAGVHLANGTTPNANYIKSKVFADVQSLYLDEMGMPVFDKQGGPTSPTVTFSPNNAFPTLGTEGVTTRHCDVYLGDFADQRLDRVFNNDDELAKAIEFVVLHEAGHAFGMKHSSGSGIMRKYAIDEPPKGPNNSFTKAQCHDWYLMTSDYTDQERENLMGEKDDLMFTK